MDQNLKIFSAIKKTKFPNLESTIFGELKYDLEMLVNEFQSRNPR